MSDSEKKGNGKDEERPIVVRNTTDLQRLKLEKLMKNPDKPVVIPERPKGRSMPSVPDFVRNVMGSSAGAGSGEFHVYRHLRRKEYARQKFIQEKSEKERLNDEYHQRIEDNKKAAEEKTAKKRAKRLKRKQKARQNAKKPKVATPQVESSEQSDSASDSEDKETNDTRVDDVGVELKQETPEDNGETPEDNGQTPERSTEVEGTRDDDDDTGTKDNAVDKAVAEGAVTT